MADYRLVIRHCIVEPAAVIRRSSTRGNFAAGRLLISRNMPAWSLLSRLSVKTWIRHGRNPGGNAATSVCQYCKKVWTPKARAECRRNAGTDLQYSAARTSFCVSECLPTQPFIQFTGLRHAFHLPAISRYFFAGKTALPLKGIAPPGRVSDGDIVSPYRH